MFFHFAADCPEAFEVFFVLAAFVVWQPIFDVGLQIAFENQFAEVVNLDVSRARVVRRVDEIDFVRS